MRRLNPKGAVSVLLALLVMMLWGSLFPCIKMGYRAFGIHTANVAEILMFAALRFLLCGVILCLYAFFSKAKLEKPRGKSLLRICLMGLFAVVLHYGFLYVGLSLTGSGKTAILKQVAPLLFSCFSFLFVQGEKFSAWKMVGALVGFGGILAMHSGDAAGAFSLGDALILCASVCTVISMCISAKSVKGSSPFWITGVSQLFGGAVLFSVALAMGGRLPTFSPQAAGILSYICVASMGGYTLFYYVQRTLPLSRLFIIKFAEPLFACLCSAFLLGEEVFRVQYLVAFLLISAGIVLGNKEKR